MQSHIHSHVFIHLVRLSPSPAKVYTLQVFAAKNDLNDLSLMRYFLMKLSAFKWGKKTQTDGMKPV